jgi:hypothetical protein
MFMLIRSTILSTEGFYYHDHSSPPSLNTIAEAIWGEGSFLVP